MQASLNKEKNEKMEKTSMCIENKWKQKMTTQKEKGMMDMQKKDVYLKKKPKASLQLAK
jgi:hypothetical protein